MQLRHLIILLRPKEWIKNGFVVAPLIFAGEFLHITSVKRTFWATCLFCLAASATYIVNDIHDRKQDQCHAQKAKIRPLASGAVSIPQAIGLLGVLYGIIIIGCIKLPSIAGIIVGYILLNVSYSFVLKHQPIIDIFTIAIGFVLRVFAGAKAIATPISSWMFITTLCLALYLAAVKRRQELLMRGKTSRKVLAQYSVSLIDRYAEMSATGALIFYSLFVRAEYPKMIWTIPFVIYGLFRYWFIVESLEGGESPTNALLKDWQLFTVTILWIVTCIYVIWPTLA